MDAKIIIMRGIQGCGKTTACQKLVEGLPVEPVVISADFNRMRNGEYHFDAKTSRDAHRMCFADTVEAMQDESPCVIIDNTNIALHEIAPYCRIAQAFGYRVEVWQFVCDPITGYNRQRHDVPFGVIQKKHAQLELAILPRDFYDDIIFIDERGRRI